MAFDVDPLTGWFPAALDVNPADDFDVVAWDAPGYAFDVELLTDWLPAAFDVVPLGPPAFAVDPLTGGDRVLDLLDTVARGPMSGRGARSGAEADDPPNAPLVIVPVPKPGRFVAEPFARPANPVVAAATGEVVAWDVPDACDPTVPTDCGLLLVRADTGPEVTVVAR